MLGPSSVKGSPTRQFQMPMAERDRHPLCFNRLMRLLASTDEGKTWDSVGHSTRRDVLMNCSSRMKRFTSFLRNISFGLMMPVSVGYR